MRVGRRTTAWFKSMDSFTADQLPLPGANDTFFSGIPDITGHIRTRFGLSGRSQELCRSCPRYFHSLQVAYSRFRFQERAGRSLIFFPFSSAFLPRRAASSGDDAGRGHVQWGGQPELSASFPEGIEMNLFSSTYNLEFLPRVLSRGFPQMSSLFKVLTLCFRDLAEHPRNGSVLEFFFRKIRAIGRVNSILRREGARTPFL